MPRVLIASSDVPYNGALEPVVWTNADASNHHYYVDDGETVLLACCSDASTKTVTINSVADPRLRRTGDESMIVPAQSANNNGLCMFGLNSGDAWRQPGTDHINVNVSAATGLRLAAVRLRRR